MKEFPTYCLVNGDNTSLLTADELLAFINAGNSVQMIDEKFRIFMTLN